MKNIIKSLLIIIFLLCLTIYGNAFVGMMGEGEVTSEEEAGSSIAVDNSGEIGNPDSNTTTATITDFTLGGGSNRLVVLCVSWEDNSDASISSATFDPGGEDIAFNSIGVQTYTDSGWYNRSALL